VLPDRWLALGYVEGRRLVTVLGPPIADTLAVGPDPSDRASPDSTAPLGEGGRWLLDFDRALEAGMALRIPLGADDVRRGLDRLIVVSVRASLDADKGARRLSDLLDAHHYTDGLGIVPAGTPTNNTPAARAGWSSSDDGYAASWRTERGAPRSAGDGSDGDRLTRAIALEGETLGHAGRAESTGDIDAGQMATALWPATWGYVLEQLVGGLSESALAELRAHTIANVRARGPFASLRVGRQPYGVLPATSLSRLALLDPADVDASIPPLLRLLVPVWTAAAASVPRVTPDAAIDEVLSSALGMSPVSLEYASRALELHPDSDSADVFARRQQALAVPRALDLDVEPRLADAGFEATVTRLTGPTVTSTPSERDPLPDDANYVRWLAESGWEAIRTGAPPSGEDTLLFALLRHAVLREYVATVLRILRARELAQADEGAEPGLGPDGPSVWERLAAAVEGVTNGEALGSHLDGVRAAGTGAGSPAATEVGELVEVQTALLHLAELPSAQLERLLAEALDVCSHRLDAWITAHAVRRLEALRSEQPTGTRLGGYGVLHDVRPAHVRALAELVAQLEAELIAARTGADAAAQAQAQVRGQLASAQAQATAADAAVASLEVRIERAQAELEALLESPDVGRRPSEDRPPSTAVQQRIRALQQQIAVLRGQLASAQAQAGATGHTLAAVAAQTAAADAAVQAAQAEVARLAAQLAEAQAAEQEAVDLAANKGFIHAPSLGQAATAAVLRSGHLAHRRDADSAFAIDLSSRRVQLALALLDGVRQGQPLGALLGYRFERALHEDHAGLELARYIATLRALAPLDDTTQAEAELRAALAREADITARLGVFEQQLAAARTADLAAKDALRHELEAAEAQLEAARATAQALARQLQQAQATLQELLERADEGGLPSHVPSWKLDDDIPEGIPPALRAQIAAADAEVRRLTAALDSANAAQRAAEARVGDLSAQLGVPDPQIATLEQAVADLQPELEQAHAAVAAVRARLEELHGQLRDRAAEAVQAANVVDGLALRRRWRAGTKDGRWDTSTIPFGDPELELPDVGSPEQQAIDAALRMVDDAVDALADLLTAESVHHLVQGNPLRAGATVDALSRGETPPPEPEVTRTPRAGIGVTHRLLVLLDPEDSAEGWPTDDRQVRARLDPALEAWATRLLGPAARVAVRVRYSWPEGEHDTETRLEALRLSALDVCAAAVSAAPAGATELELRLLDHVARNRPDGVPADADVELELERDSSWAGDVLSLAELMEVARQLRELLLGARTLDARDFALPSETTDAGVNMAELARRAAFALDALEGARDALAAGDDPHDALLRAAALGVPGAVPLAGTELPAAQAAAVAQELDRRRADAAEAESDAARIAAVLGPEWPVLARVTPPAATELEAAFAASDELQDRDPLAAVTWLQRAAHVREGAARLEGMLMYAEAVQSPERLSLRVAQLPLRPADRWAGLPATDDHPIEGGRVSLVAQAAVRPVTEGRAVAGLVIDEWTEVVPAATQVTGVSFHFDQPNSRAPQAILLAVPPTEEHVWTLDALEAVLLETLDLAELRLADEEALARAGSTAGIPGVGHYLPAIYLASSPADRTVTTDLARVAAPS
jgi:seryl-tRNA synthetase